MHPHRVPVLAGNWKLNKGLHETGGFVRELVAELKDREQLNCEVVIAPTFTSLAVAQQAVWGSPIKVAAQNCHWADSGAFTGEVSAEMLYELGISHVILGHSERRQYFAETDDTVAQRVTAALQNGLTVIACVGEVLEERESGQMEAVLLRQLDAILAATPKEIATELIVAYEPVWAIGTGKVATTEQAQEVHALLRTHIAEKWGDDIAQKIRILYGGSANPDNVADLLACADVDGALVGGASLVEDKFMAMIDVADQRATA